MQTERLCLKDAAWSKVLSDDDLKDNLRIALREALICSSDTLKAQWLQDAKLIKLELKERGINWLRVIKV